MIVSRGGTELIFPSFDEFTAYMGSLGAGFHPLSLGGAASRLGVTRQRIAGLQKQGKIRSVRVYDSAWDMDSGARPAAVLVSGADVEAYAKAPKDKGGRSSWKSSRDSDAKRNVV
jgi:hypothetical protein